MSTDPLAQLEATGTSYGEIDRSTIFYSPPVTPVTPSRSDIDLTLFVACYNEEGNIVDALETTIAAAGELSCSWEIIVIDDASRDRSVELIKRFMADHPECPITLVVRQENQGLAQNYIEGAFIGRGKYYKLVCGDNVESKEQLVNILGHMGKADMIVPYHVHAYGRSATRMAISRTFTRIVNTLSGYRIRYYNGVGVYMRYDVMRWNTNYHGFGFQADLITRLLDQGKSFVEVAATTTERASGTSKAITLRNFFSVAHFFLDLFIRRVGRSYRHKGARPAA